MVRLVQFTDKFNKFALLLESFRKFLSTNYHTASGRVIDPRATAPVYEAMNNLGMPCSLRTAGAQI